MSLRSVIASLIPEQTRKRLRGDYNSVTKRFITAPAELAAQRILSLFGVNYLRWYADRLDRMLKERSGKDLVGNVYFDSGHEDLAVLKIFGLKPHHTLFEIGTGEGRSAQHIAAYLDAGNLLGNDTSAERVRQLHEYFSEIGLSEKRADIIVTTNNNFDWFEGGKKVDYIWSNAVLSHIPDNDVREMLANMTNIMHKDTIALISVAEADGIERTVRYTVKDWLRPPAFYEKAAHEVGLKFSDESSHLPYGERSYPYKKSLGQIGRAHV